MITRCRSKAVQYGKKAMCTGHVRCTEWSIGAQTGAQNDIYHWKRSCNQSNLIYFSKSVPWQTAFFEGEAKFGAFYAILDVINPKFSGGACPRTPLGECASGACEWLRHPVHNCWFTAIVGNYAVRCTEILHSILAQGEGRRACRPILFLPLGYFQIWQLWDQDLKVHPS